MLLWLLADDPHLGPAARSTISDGTEVFVSAVSFCELVTKVGLGNNGSVATPRRTPRSGDRPRHSPASSSLRTPRGKSQRRPTGPVPAVSRRVPAAVTQLVA